MAASIAKAQFVRRTWLVLIFAMVFPTVATWTYLLALARSDSTVNTAQQAAYLACKCAQFLTPLVYLGLVGGPWPRMRRPGRRGMGIGIAFGLVVATVMLGVYFGLLRHSSLLARTPAQLRHKLAQVGMASPGGYLALAGFVVMAHSFLEEYYWRWFVFGQLRCVVSLGPALILSSLAFMAHHVVVLYVYVPGQWAAVVVFALAIAIGGMVWAWVYERAGTLYASWLSHMLVDGAIFVIGWDLMFGVVGR